MVSTGNEQYSEQFRNLSKPYTSIKYKPAKMWLTGNGSVNDLYTCQVRLTTNSLKP